MKVCVKCKNCTWHRIDECDGQEEFDRKKCPVEQKV